MRVCQDSGEGRLFSTQAASLSGAGAKGDELDPSPRRFQMHPVRNLSTVTGFYFLHFQSKYLQVKTERETQSLNDLTLPSHD